MLRPLFLLALFIIIPLFFILIYVMSAYMRGLTKQP